MHDTHRARTECVAGSVYCERSRSGRAASDMVMVMTQAGKWQFRRRCFTHYVASIKSTLIYIQPTPPRSHEAELILHALVRRIHHEEHQLHQREHGAQCIRDLNIRRIGLIQQ